MTFSSLSYICRGAVSTGGSHRYWGLGLELTCEGHSLTHNTMRVSKGALKIQLSGTLKILIYLNFSWSRLGLRNPLYAGLLSLAQRREMLPGYFCGNQGFLKENFQDFLKKTSSHRSCTCFGGEVRNTHRLFHPALLMLEPTPSSKDLLFLPSEGRFWGRWSAPLDLKVPSVP